MKRHASSHHWRHCGFWKINITWLALTCLGVWLTPHSSNAQIFYEQEPINYLTAPVKNSITRLQERIDKRTTKLVYDEAHGYLKSVLAELRVPQSSQMLVFSKTSFQLTKISPQSPRAVYFGDDVYVGWVQGGDVVEISAADPDLGVVFYSLDQRPTAAPQFTRRGHECLQCHGSSLTRDLPGHVVRSVYPAPDGQPVFSAGTYLTTHQSPLKERWGGWYVTGTHGSQRHMGNALLRDRDSPETFNADGGANVESLKGRFDTTPYLTPHSDIVALLVLEHQAEMHNLITRANFATRIALRDESVMNQALERPADYRSPSTERRIASPGESLVRYLLFTNETPLQGEVRGSSDFAKEFSALGPRDKRGRSLRDLDLHTRLFKHPCSYMIYHETFDKLPPPVLDYVYKRLWDILTGRDQSEDFARLSASDRQAILEILRETKPNLPATWLAKP